ncbi:MULTISPECIES: hypothetical protein [Colwellia]|uniref:Uncharacterized protein n=1 Tax=Colwellia marinimaniae TaxID=1513592 RepID=A0ABQ0MT38_9GAMM|nr:MULTISPECIES: hypothetical protein [Colwellia]GAW95520.1 hypothetical protein MTCD1_01123 [Colwellia marinimaniae]
MISVPFSLVESNTIARSSQPVSIGFPFVLGTVSTDTKLAIQSKDGQLVSCQISPLTFWHDGSVKWAMIDFVVDISSNETLLLNLTDDFSDQELSSDQGQIKLLENNKQLEINTGLETFTIGTSQGELLSIVSSALSQNESKSENFYIQLTNSKNEKYKAVIDNVCVDLIEASTHRKSLTINGCFVDANKKQSKLLFESTLTFFANTSYIKVDFTLHNPQAAKHPGALWDLGDEGSISFESLSVNIPVDSNASVNIYDHVANKAIACGKNTFLKQFSSGGVNWNSPVHKNAAGKVEIEKNGFVINSDSDEHEGMRISPAFSVKNKEDTVSVYIEKFWQNFPKAISKQNESLTVELFPEGNFELQGGEKKSHALWIDFKSPTQSFNWLDKPLTVIIEPQYIEQTGAFDFFKSSFKQNELSAIIEKGIHGPSNFFEKREAVDEYGWRNFGDLYADHETQGYAGNDIFVSHYNNQYDPIYGFVYQYLASGHANYFELADDLTKHVADIDIYHTVNDKDEYNGGLFWHTDHYLDASTCTHRTFSKNHQAAYEGYTSGGGPGVQHCYTTGLKSYYLLTGNEKAKKAVLQLTDWITYSFEGSNSLLAKLFAIKQSGNPDVKDHISEKYPMDRGTGHYIIALLDAYDLTQQQNYLARAFKVISNTFHPNDDISLRDFDNIEATWFYTVFLQSVGRFLLVKERIKQLDDDFYYARDAMLHYADWMLNNELPYLEQSDKLEFPNTTWAGQDLRRVGIFYMANYYSPIKNELLLEKAAYFHQHIVNTLQNDTNNDYTRILVLLMQNIGFANFYQYSSSQNDFENIRKYAKPVKVNKGMKICILLFKELSRLSIKNELKWLSLRSAKVAKLLGNKG